MTNTKAEPDFDPQLVPGPWLLKCPECSETMWASVEDPDAAQGEMFNHISAHHAVGEGYDRRTSAHALLARVRVVEHGLCYPADAVELATMLRDPEFRARAMRAGYVAGAVVIVSDLVRSMRQQESGEAHHG